MLLNQEQRAAVESPGDQPLLLCAGPGSGKTRVLTSRVVWLLRNPHNHVNHVCCLSFSKAACTTFQQRLATMLAPLELSRVKICTFHSLCLRLCRKNPDLLGIDGLQPNDTFHLCNTSEQYDYIKDVLEALKIKPGQGPSPSDILTQINQAKATSQSPEDYDDQPLFQQIFTLFNRKMLDNTSLSFLDIVVSTVHLFRTHPRVLQQFQQQYTHLTCDEFQDTSRLQFSLLTLLGSHRRVTVVGDDQQSIFKFAGSDVANFDYFVAHFYEQCIELKLEMNYRR
jgi:DNA helicase-2/ATP-dependent DNA helicase PcrA